MTNEITTSNTMTEIVEAYNALTELKVKKFSTKEIGVKRLNKLLESVSADLTKTSVLSQVLAPLKKSGALFTPDEVQLEMPNGDIVPDKKAVIDADLEHDNYIATVGTGYKVISNRDVFTQFANVLQESSLDTTDMKARTICSKARTYVQFTFPKHSVEVRDNDLIELQIVARNSYDGSMRFSLEIGGFRLLCSNGMGIGSYTNVYSNKHSSGFSYEKMAKYLETAVKVFDEAGEEWKKMTKIPVTNDDALEVLRVMTERPGIETYTEVMEGKNTVLKAALIEWERYVKELGLNKFALYNTVTHLSSHAVTAKGDIVGLRIYKEKLRDKALSTPTFRKERKVA